MDLPRSLQSVKNITNLDDRVRNTLDQVFDKVFDLVNGKKFNLNTHSILERKLFVETLKDWCQNNPEKHARLLTIRPWDESTDSYDGDYFVEAIRREMIPVIDEQFDNSVLFTQLDSNIFALFITEEQGSLARNDFDWASKLEAFETSLSQSIPLSFHLMTANWPRDASTYMTLLDVASPTETDLVELCYLSLDDGQSNDPFNSVLQSDLSRLVIDNLPSSIRNKLPIRRFLN